MKLPSLQHAGPVRAVALSHCGGFLFVSTREQGWLFSWPGGQLRQTVKIAPIYDAVFKDDGMLAICGARTITMVGLPHLDRRPSAKRVSGTAVPAAVWIHGDRLVSASMNPGRALLLDFAGNRLATLAADGEAVWSVASDDRRIAIHSDTLRVYDDTTLAVVGTVWAHRFEPGTVPAVRLHEDGKRVHSEQPAVHGLAFTPSGKTLVSAGADGRICAWDAATLQKTGDLVQPGLDPRRLILVSERIGYLTATSGLYRIDLEAPRIDRLIPLQTRHYRWNTPIGLSRSTDGRTLVFGGLTGAIGVWDLHEDTRVS